MTVFEFDTGDRASVETLRGNVESGEVVRCRHVDNDPHVTVQVSENVSLERPLSDVTSP